MVAALFVRGDSIYKTLPNVDSWDAERDARSWPGGMACVAHPPCAQWSVMRHLAKKCPATKALALRAVDYVRRHGGVLEHPKGSDLWRVAELPAPGKSDLYGGWTLPVSQKWWGHLAEKQTLLYIVGCRPADVPPIPYDMAEAKAVIDSSSRNKHYPRVAKRPYLRKSDRDKTPPAFAEWLVELARRCSPRDSTGSGHG